MGGVEVSELYTALIAANYKQPWAMAAKALLGRVWSRNV